jgi:hypothetical protein
MQIENKIYGLNINDLLILMRTKLPEDIEVFIIIT